MYFAYLCIILCALVDLSVQQVCSCPPDGSGCANNNCGWVKDKCNLCCSDLFYPSFGWAPHHGCNWKCACGGTPSTCRLKLSDCRNQCQGPNTGVNFSNTNNACWCKCTCAWGNQAACDSYCADIGYLRDSYVFNENNGACSCTCKAPPTPPPTWRPGCTGMCPTPMCDPAPNGCQWVLDNALDECDCPLHPCGTLQCSQCGDPCGTCTTPNPPEGCRWLEDASVTACGCKVWPCGVPTCSCQCAPPPNPTQCAEMLPPGCSYGSLTSDVDACGCIKFPCGTISCPPTPSPTPSPTNSDAPSVNCVLSGWSAWAPDPCHCDECPCPKFRKRTRSVLTPPSGNGTACASTLESERCSCSPPTPVPQPTNALAPSPPTPSPGAACVNLPAACEAQCGDRGIDRCPCTGTIVCVGDMLIDPNAGPQPYVWALAGVGSLGLVALVVAAVYYYRKWGNAVHDPLASMTDVKGSGGESEGRSRRRRSRAQSKSKLSSSGGGGSVGHGSAPPPKPGSGAAAAGHAASYDQVPRASAYGGSASGYYGEMGQYGEMGAYGGGSVSGAPAATGYYGEQQQYGEAGNGYNTVSSYNTEFGNQHHPQQQDQAQGYSYGQQQQQYGGY